MVVAYLGGTYDSNAMRREWVVFALGVVLLAAYWLSPLARNRFENADLAIYQAALSDMRQGDPYYSSMSAALDSTITVDGGPFVPSSVRSFRLPTLFWLWAAAPWLYSWPAVLTVCIVTGILVGLLWQPLGGLGLVFWELLLIYPTSQMHLPGFSYPPSWGYVEIWVAPMILAGMLAMRRANLYAALALVLVAALSRELAFPCLLTGAIAARRAGGQIAPWLAAAVGCLAFYLWHAEQAIPFLVHPGNESPLLGSGGLTGLLMNADAGAGVRVLGILGCVPIAWAAWTRRWSSEWWLAAPLVIGLPIVGLFASRAYWSLLVVPPALALFGASRMDQQGWRSVDEARIPAETAAEDI